MSRRLDWSGLNANFGFTRKKGCTIFSLSCRMLEICWVMIHTITEIVIYFFIWVKFRENLLTIYLRTVFENRRKSIIQQCGRVDKNSLKIPKMVNLASFRKTEVCLSNSVTRQVTFNLTKIGGKCQNSKIEMRYFFLDKTSL